MTKLTPGQWSRIPYEPRPRSELRSESEAETESERLDVALARLAPELSRSRVQKLIEEGHVRRNGEPAKANIRLGRGDLLEVFLPAPRPLGLRAECIPIKILYQDEHLAVIEKPAGLVVHPAVGHAEGTLVNALLHHFTDLSAGAGIGGELRPGIVHRIDKNTSGILLVTKTDLAHQQLSRQFKEHTITRKYLGLCWGRLPTAGEWNDPIARDPKERKRMAIVPGGRTARTRFRALHTYAAAISLFEAELFTGRTHQIRVHFSVHGFPLAGDPVYGNATRAARQAREEGIRKLGKSCAPALARLSQLQEKGRQFLHAAHLGFVHPVSGQNLRFDSELPSDLQEIVLSLSACESR